MLKKILPVMLSLGLLALSSSASAGEWWSQQYKPPYWSDGGTQIIQEGQANTWRDTRWSGQATYCPWEAAGPCTHTYGESHSVSYTHTVNVGLSLAGSTNPSTAFGTLQATFGYAYAWTRTETKTWSFSVQIPKGKHAQPVAYVHRAWSWGHFRGGHKFLNKKRDVPVGCYNGWCNWVPEYAYEWRWDDFGHWEGHNAKSGVIVSFDIW